MALKHDRNMWRATVLGVALVTATTPAGAEESALLAPGVAAYQAGKTEQAIKALSGVLTDKAATGNDLARAYYFRGLAYGKAGKPAQAIADLNNALWLKGLTSDERANAHLARGKAYQAAGLEARATQDFREAEKLAPGAASQELAAVSASEAPAAVEQQDTQAAAVETAAGASAPTGTTALVLTPSTVQTTVKSPSKSATSTATVGGTTTETSSSAQATDALRERGGTISRTSGAEALSTATVPPDNGSLSSIFSGGGGLFSNLFSSGSSSEPAVTDSTSVPAAETTTPKRKSTLARGESVDFSSTTSPVVTAESAGTVVASSVPASPATDTPLVLTPTSVNSTAATGAVEADFTAETAAAEPQVSSWASTVAEEPAAFAATSAAAPAASGGGDVVSDVGTSIGSFFEGLFAGAPPSDATATAGSAVTQPASQERELAVLESTNPAAVEPVQVTPTGRYRAQIATVRSAEEAAIIAHRMQTERKALLGNLRADVEPVVLGNMGTFYAVMVGPFADERSSERFCGKLQNEGVDCFVAEP
jgi:hypothetical protein